MTVSNRLLTLAASLCCLALPARAQGPAASNANDDWWSTQRKQTIQYFKFYDARSMNVFESPKVEGVAYKGFVLDFGGAFTQQFQSLTHENTATPVVVAGVNQNKLIEIGNGFNNAVANFYIDGQLAKGVRMNLTMYLSSKHHNETWVKEGYVLIDAAPFAKDMLDGIFKDVTLKVGHMETNYGDAHFRRSDNGETMFNPLVGNLMMDAFTTEIGAELYYRPANGLIGMLGATNGEIRGTVFAPTQREAAYLMKVGFDKQFTDVRFRLTGSLFSQSSAASNTLYGGDRGGSRYGYVLENTAASSTGNAWSGNVDPLMKDRLNAIMINPFVRAGGFEFFGTFEQAKGRSATETNDRTFTQMATEFVYRFAANDKFFVAARWNDVKGDYLTAPGINVTRMQFGGGWFLTPSLMAKLEAVQQEWKNFPANDIRNGGKFSGVMLEAVITF